MPLHSLARLRGLCVFLIALFLIPAALAQVEVAKLRPDESEQCLGGLFFSCGPCAEENKANASCSSAHFDVCDQPRSGWTSVVEDDNLQLRNTPKDYGVALLRIAAMSASSLVDEPTSRKRLRDADATENNRAPAKKRQRIERTSSPRHLEEQALLVAHSSNHESDPGMQL